MTKNSKSPLPGHTRVKKKMVPDFLLKMPMQFSRYEDDVLPELIGIAMINDAHGYTRGNEISLVLAKNLKASRRIGSPLISAFGGLREDELESMSASLNEKGMLEDVCRAFTPINRILGPTPLLKFPQVNAMTDSECVDHLRVCVGRHLNRYSHPATCALATLYYTQAVLGRINIAKGLHVPDLEEIHRAPESEEGQRSAADVRMFSLMEIGMHKDEYASDWPSLFWSRCRKASACNAFEPSESGDDE